MAAEGILHIIPSTAINTSCNYGTWPTLALDPPDSAANIAGTSLTLAGPIL